MRSRPVVHRQLNGRSANPARDRGVADALALVLIAPAVVGLALLVVFLGRAADARAQAQSVAESAAQAAALERNFVAAELAAHRVADAMLATTSSCFRHSVAVASPASFRPGGSVTVTITCEATDQGVEVVQPEPLQYTARAVATIDTFRAAG